MYKKAVVAIIIFASLSAVIFTLFRLKKLKQYERESFYKAIPISSTGFLVINDPLKLSKTFKSNRDIVNDLTAFLFIDTTIVSFFNMDSIYSGLKRILFESPMAISFEQIDDTLCTTLYFTFENRLNESNFFKLLKEKIPNINNVKFKKLSLNKIIIYGMNCPLYLGEKDGILIVSASSKAVDKALTQYENEDNLLCNNEIIQLRKTINEQALVNLFLKSNCFNDLHEGLADFDCDLQLFSNADAWVGLDLNKTDDGVSFIGFLNLKNDSTLISSMFNSYSASETEINEVFPFNTCYYQSFNVNSNNHLDSINKKNINKDNLKPLIENIESEFAIVNSKGREDVDKYLIMKIKGKSTTFSSIEKLLGMNTGEMKPVAYFTPDNEISIPIYEGFANEELSKYLSGLIKKTPDKFFAFNNDYLFFSNSIKSLSRLLYDNLLKKTLLNREIYKNYLKNFSNTENYFIHISPGYLPYVLEDIIKESVVEKLKVNKELLDQFFGLGIQLSRIKDQAYINGYLYYTPNREDGPKTIWESKLDTIVTSKPVFVVNHYTQEKEILVQDAKNNLYLINNAGIILWKKPIGEKVMGVIEQIDYYKNQKLQFVFNTKSRIYVIDRNGNYVDKFPIQLASTATNSVSVFDYDKNLDYRFFMACEDRSVIVMDKKGNILPDWRFKGTDKLVHQPIIHGRVNGKDYIIVTDLVRHYILNRRGKERVFLKSDFKQDINTPLYEYKSSSNALKYVSMTDKGDIALMNITEGIIEIYPSDFKVDRCSFKPLNTGKNIYVFSDKNRIRVSDIYNRVLWEKNLANEIVESTDIYQFSYNNYKIGIVDNINNIHLYNSDGTEYKGFPLVGTSRYSIGFLSSEETKFNLIVGGIGGFLYKYEVK
ncbi:MAG: hypothetical protein JW717_10250 [Marinilabiliaceae bacterium]|nr:hypothetical protein [Marinilabiliaceae bacterium]